MNALASACALSCAQWMLLCLHVHDLEHSERSGVCLHTTLRAMDALVFACVLSEHDECSGVCLCIIMRAMGALAFACVLS